MIESGNEDSLTVAIFPTTQYLGDASLRRAVARLLLSTKNGGPGDQEARGIVLSFHPVSQDALKQKADMDVYALMGVQGEVVRTHVVTRNGVAHVNPPPVNQHCESCHAKGRLQQRFQYSKIDGANISVWLCHACSKLEPEKRDIMF